MKRLLASLAAVAFIVGMLVLPAVHRLHCDESSSHHEADCPVCHLANTPLNTTDTHVAVVTDAPLAAASPIPYLPAPITPASDDATQARAPPAA